jgi:hypothetical protein
VGSPRWHDVILRRPEPAIRHDKRPRKTILEQQALKAVITSGRRTQCLRQPAVQPPSTVRLAPLT